MYDTLYAILTGLWFFPPPPLPPFQQHLDLRTIAGHSRGETAHHDHDRDHENAQKIIKNKNIPKKTETPCYGRFPPRLLPGSSQVPPRFPRFRGRGSAAGSNIESRWDNIGTRSAQHGLAEAIQPPTRVNMEPCPKTAADPGRNLGAKPP